MTIYELEERVQRIEHIVHGTPKEPGILPMLVEVANDVHGADGVSGMKKELHETADAIKGAKQWMAGGVAIGTVAAAIIVWLLEKFVLKP